MEVDAAGLLSTIMYNQVKYEYRGVSGSYHFYDDEGYTFIEGEFC